MLFASIFTIKFKEILENIYRENFSEDAADKQPIEPTDWPQEKRNLLRSIEDKDIFLAEFDERLKETKEELSAANNQIRKDEEQIISLKNDLKIERERIKSLENEVIKLEKLEKNKTTSEITNSSKQKSKTKTNDRRRKSKKKKSSTQEIKKGKITEIQVKTTSDDKYLDNHFAAQSRDLKFLLTGKMK
jgi:antitoxin component YwqK of YwqJK toxin-antitoxin module